MALNYNQAEHAALLLKLKEKTKHNEEIVVDCEKHIDSALVNSNSWLAPDSRRRLSNNNFWLIKGKGCLSEADMEELKLRYKNAGWYRVRVKNEIAPGIWSILLNDDFIPDPLTT